MKKNLKITILICFAIVFSYAGIYLSFFQPDLSSREVVTMGEQFWSITKLYVGIIGLCFGHYIMFLAGRVK